MILEEKKQGRVRMCLSLKGSRKEPTRTHPERHFLERTKPDIGSKDKSYKVLVLELTDSRKLHSGHIVKIKVRSKILRTLKRSEKNPSSSLLGLQQIFEYLKLLIWVNRWAGTHSDTVMNDTDRA
jgi:hypothetical protein